MVDIGGKKITSRSAHARTYIILPKELMSLFSEGEIKTPKGPVFNTAIVAGVMAAKKTHEFIPFCHPIQSIYHNFRNQLDDKKE
jgi:cyclic pyranopterin phosphate synthase